MRITDIEVITFKSEANNSHKVGVRRVARRPATIDSRHHQNLNG